MSGNGDPGLLIVSGADRAYFPLLRDTVASIRALCPGAALGILDLGLAPEERQWLEAARRPSRAPGLGHRFSATRSNP